MRKRKIDIEQAMEMVDILLDGDWSDQVEVERAYRAVRQLQDNNDPLPVDVAMAQLQVQFNAGQTIH